LSIQMVISIPPLFSKRYYIILSVLGMIAVSAACFRCASGKQVRIACFPISSSLEWLDLCIADGMNVCLTKSTQDPCLVYPLDWMVGAIETDSSQNVSYLKAYSRRVGLDFLITHEIQSTFREGCSVCFTLHDLKQNHSRIVHQDSLFYGNPTFFFLSAAQKICQGADLDFYNCKDISFPPFRLWESYGMGRYYRFSQDLKKSENALRSGIASDSTSAGLIKELIWVLLEEGLQEQSKGNFVENIYLETSQWIHRILRTHPDDLTALRLLGRLYIQKGSWNQAEKTLQKILNDSSKDPFLYFDLARLHHSRFRKMGYRSKIQLLMRALQINPAFERARLVMGEEYTYRNRKNSAERIYKDVLFIHPTSLDALLALGKLYIVQNDIPNMIYVYQRVLDIDPGYAIGYYNLGIAYYGAGKPELASRFFMKAIDLNGPADSYFYMGILHAEKGEKDAAIDFFRKRIHNRKGVMDPFAEEARKRLLQLFNEKDKER
jgi:tetratricopeptide (TPR) repeat protein